MYLIDVHTVDRDGGGRDKFAFVWGSHEDRVERMHDDGHLSHAGSADSIGDALNKVMFACMLAGRDVTSATISREE